jgi:hypothetical protein
MNKTFEPAYHEPVFISVNFDKLIVKLTFFVLCAQINIDRIVLLNKGSCTIGIGEGGTR